MSNGKSLDEFLQNLTNPDDELREEAAAGLVGTDNPKALVPLMTAASDPHPGVKYFAKKALKQLQTHIAKTVGLEDNAPPPPSAPQKTDKIEDDPLALDDIFGDNTSKISKMSETPKQEHSSTPPSDGLDFDDIFDDDDNDDDLEIEEESDEAEETENDATADEEASVTDFIQTDNPPTVAPKTGINDSNREKIEKIQEIATSGDVSRLPVILKLLKAETDKFILATLVKAVGKLGSKEHMDAILPFLRDKDNRVVANTIESLELLENHKCVQPLLKIISHKDNRVRANAMKAIWHFARNNPLANKLIMDRLKEMIFSSKSNMRESAIYVLGEIGSENALDMVSLSMNDSEESVRNKAQEAVKKIEAQLYGTTGPPKTAAPAETSKEIVLGENEDENDDEDEATEETTTSEVSNRRSKTPPKKPSFKRTPVKKARTPIADSDEDVPPAQDGDIVTAVKRSGSAPKKAVIGGFEAKNPMKNVVKIAVALTIFISLLIGGVIYATGGDFTPYGIPITLFAVPEVDNSKEEFEIKQASLDDHLKEGNSFLKEGFFDEAIKEFKMILKEDKEHKKAKEGVAKAHLKRGEEFTNLEIYDKAKEEFEKCLKWAESGSTIRGTARENLERIEKSKGL